jgi:hypothetical protein
MHNAYANPVQDPAPAAATPAAIIFAKDDRNEEGEGHPRKSSGR